jgi:hypothetical protein
MYGLALGLVSEQSGLKAIDLRHKICITMEARQQDAVCIIEARQKHFVVACSGACLTLQGTAIAHQKVQFRTCTDRACRNDCMLTQVADLIAMAATDQRGTDSDNRSRQQQETERDGSTLKTQALSQDELHR